MTQLIKLVIGALVALDLTAALSLPYLTLEARYVGNNRSIVSLDCHIGGHGSFFITSIRFFKRVGAAQYLLANWYPSVEQFVILNQTDTSITFRFSQTQEGYFRCQTQGLHVELKSNEIGLAGSNTICVIHVCRYTVYV